MMDWIMLIILITCSPIMGLLNGEFELILIYCLIQAAVLLIAYFLQKSGIITSVSPFVHYIAAFIIGHVVYVVTIYRAFMHYGGFMP